jgi:aminoglycoside phosphotransferase (APT) family kinase protein
VDVNEVAAALGVTVEGRLPHGANAGAYAVRTADDRDAVLKIDAGESSKPGLVGALRARGYPIPAVISTGSVDGIAYELTERVDGEPMNQPTTEQLLAVLRTVALQRAIGLGTGDWIEHIVTSVTDGCSGYCEHAAMQAHSDETRALLERLRRLADARRDAEVAADDAVHYDFSPYNVLVRGDDVAGVVDWGGARLGDAAFDLVTMAFYTYEASVRDELLAAAGETTSPDALGLYVAHMIVRQTDWSLRHQTEAEVEWFMGIGNALVGRVAP